MFIIIFIHLNIIQFNCFLLNLPGFDFYLFRNSVFNDFVGLYFILIF